MRDFFSVLVEIAFLGACSWTQELDTLEIQVCRGGRDESLGIAEGMCWCASSSCDSEVVFLGPRQKMEGSKVRFTPRDFWPVLNQKERQSPGSESRNLVTRGSWGGDSRRAQSTLISRRLDSTRTLLLAVKRGVTLRAR